MVQFLRRTHANVDTPLEAIKWYRIFKGCTAFIKAIIIANIVLVGCDPLRTDYTTKVRFLYGTAV